MDAPVYRSSALSLSAAACASDSIRATFREERNFPARRACPTVWAFCTASSMTERLAACSSSTSSCCRTLRPVPLPGATSRAPVSMISPFRWMMLSSSPMPPTFFPPPASAEGPTSGR